MKMCDLEDKMRKFECYHSDRVLPNTWIVIRVDGKGFSKLTENNNFTKPFSNTFSDYMVKTATTLFDEFDAIYAFTEHDEISILLRFDADLYDRRVEKLATVSAGITSAAFTKYSNILGAFDSRIIVLPQFQDVIDYFQWRQNDAARCSINSYCYWTARNLDELSVGQATKLFERQTNAFKNEYLFSHDINFNDLPTWQRRGTGIYRCEYIKEGYNPIKNESILVSRKKPFIDRELPMKSDYGDFIENLKNNDWLKPL